MPAQWTAELVMKMHLNGITQRQLAAKAGIRPEYLSAIMKGHREPKHAESTLNEALDELIGEKEE